MLKHRPSVIAALLVVLTLAVAPSAFGRTAAAPQRGIFVVGRTLAGVGIGYTEERVEAHWGKSYTVCQIPSLCSPRDVTWFFLTSKSGEPLGVGVRFVGGKSVAVFTLGAAGVAPLGTSYGTTWKTSDGLKMLDPVSNIYTIYPGATLSTNCSFYTALTVKTGPGIKSSFFSSSGVIYGFALAAANQPICV